MLPHVLVDGTGAAAALRRGEVAAAAATAAALESVLGGDAGFATVPLPLSRAKDGWAIGCTVESGAIDPALAVQAATNERAACGGLGRSFEIQHVNWRSA